MARVAHHTCRPRTKLLLLIICGILSAGSRVAYVDASVPAGMALIPAGPFLMGDTFGEGSYDEVPVHTVTVSAFYMGTREVTNDEMLAVLRWALENDRVEVTTDGLYSRVGDRRELMHIEQEQCRISWDGVGFSLKPEKGAGYPCVEVTWHGAVAYCNFRSEMEGRAPCYNLDDWSCNWAATGYRLPTDAEWEKAARGGVVGRRFPWGDTDTIDHSRSNYRSTSDFDYDVSPTRGLHPDHDYGASPYTSPVGSFPPNGYGLYDMDGNVWEWVWDFWASDYYGVSPATDPHGPETGSYRVLRSGRWGYDASACRVSARRHGWPAGRWHMGFRIALNASPENATTSLRSRSQ